MEVVGSMNMISGEWSFGEKFINGVSELADYELDFVTGGIDGVGIANGVLGGIGVVGFIVAAPVSVPTAALYGVAVLGGAAVGYIIGTAIMEK
jgi:hypothetical protein